MIKLLARLFLAAILVTTQANSLLAAPPGKNPSSQFASGDETKPRINHVFVIVLENEGFDVTFGPNSKAPLLSKTLTSQGVLLNQYFGTGHVSLDNYVAMLSGQADTQETRSDCQTYADFVLTGTTADGQAIGSGCVYPPSVKTLPDQLNAIGKTWRGYMEDMGNDPAREAATCGHPALNSIDHTQAAEAPSASVPLGDQYASRHDPFVYFHSIIDSPDCNTNVVNLNRLPQDLSSEQSTPNFVFITPNLCNDGHDAPCKNGQPGGLVSADAFLQKWIPLIQASKAYHHDGLIVITFDEGGLSVGPNPNAPGILSQRSRPILLQRAARSQSRSLSADHRDRSRRRPRFPKLRRRPHWHSTTLPVPQTRNCLQHSVQSLLFAENARGYFRHRRAPRLRRSSWPSRILRLRDLGHRHQRLQPVPPLRITQTP
jgi:phosphatidylinositol-3-phosphatase